MTRVEELGDYLYNKIESTLIRENSYHSNIILTKLFGNILDIYNGEVHVSWDSVVHSFYYNHPKCQNAKCKMQILLFPNSSEIKIFENTENHKIKTLKDFIYYKLSKLDKSQLEKVWFEFL